MARLRSRTACCARRGLGCCRSRARHGQWRTGSSCEGMFRLLHQAELQRALQDLTEDLTVAEFLRRHFAGPLYGALRRSIERMAEGYDAADPERASTQALRDEWMVGGHHTQGRIIGGYGALVEFLTAECRHQGVAIRLGRRFPPSKRSIGAPWSAARTATLMGATPSSLRYHFPSSTRSCFRRRNARERRRLPISASATSSRSCCGSRPPGGSTGERISSI